mmetsp:Transcript_16526/g.56978  ORF Transcript_16526/g.56978 Transcript_16526/m.56978 type:complete len:295 (-) Transcript_16526:159-1043(-)
MPRVPEPLRRQLEADQQQQTTERARGAERRRRRRAAEDEDNFETKNHEPAQPVRDAAAHVEDRLREDVGPREAAQAARDQVPQADGLQLRVVVQGPPELHLDGRHVERRRERDDADHGEPVGQHLRQEPPQTEEHGAHVRRRRVREVERPGLEHGDIAPAARRPAHIRRGDGGLLADPAALARVFERVAEGEPARVEDGHREAERARDDARRRRPAPVVLLRQRARELDGEADEDAHEDPRGRGFVEQFRPVAEADQLLVGHHRQARLAAIKPNVGEVAADDGHGQVLGERREP